MLRGQIKNNARTLTLIPVRPPRRKNGGPLGRTVLHQISSSVVKSELQELTP